MSEGASAPDPIAVMRDRRYLALLALVSVVGVICSLAAWGFLELLHEMQPWVYTDLPDALGFDKAPAWWPLPVLGLAGVLAALAITRLPGTGGHIPAAGLNASPIGPVELPGVIAAALASIGLGMTLGPEAPLIALGGGLGLLAANRVRGAQPEAKAVIGASGTFAAVSFLFGSPMIAAILLIEATGLGGPRLPLILIPGLLASGIGALVSTGLDSWTGLDTSDISLDPIPLADFARPDIVDFLWTVPLAAAIAVGIVGIFQLGKRVVPLAAARPIATLSAIGLAVGALALVFTEVTDKANDYVLFSGQESIGPLVQHAATWSTGALALLIACKGIAYGLALGSFRGGPVFPAMFLGTAAGVMAAQLPGFELTPAVVVGIGAATAAGLRLPLSALVIAAVLSLQAGPGAVPLAIVGVVVAYLTAQALAPSPPPGSQDDAPAAPAARAA
jgi:H+/Cl- antiporter ClcA